MFEEKERIVEVIEEGRIIKVSERYARREGLPILRRPKSEEMQGNIASFPPSTSSKKIVKEENRRPLLDYMYKPRDWKEKQVISELVDNFNWTIRSERKKKCLTRVRGY